MNAPANLLAISPELRERHADWKVAQRWRIERGYEWAPAEAKARELFLAAARETPAEREKLIIAIGGQP